MAVLNDAPFAVAFAAAQGRPVCCLDPGAGRAFLERASPWAMGADSPRGRPLRDPLRGPGRPGTGLRRPEAGSI